MTTPLSKAELKAEVARLTARFNNEREQHHLYFAKADRLEKEKANETLQRVSAQRGLVPYVRSLEAFHGWLLERPELARQVEPVMRELGIWAIKLGYDPDTEVALSVVGAARR